MQSNLLKHEKMYRFLLLYHYFRGGHTTIVIGSYFYIDAIPRLRTAYSGEIDVFNIGYFFYDISHATIDIPKYY